MEYVYESTLKTLKDFQNAWWYWWCEEGEAGGGSEWEETQEEKLDCIFV